MSQRALTLTRREAAFFFAAAVTAPGLAFAEAGPKIALRLLATSDLHCYLEAYDYYHDAPEDTVGLVRVAALVKQARAEIPNCLLFDNGDLIQGNPVGDLAALGAPHGADNPHPIIRAMNAMGYDAATAGNHDFNYGLDYLDGAVRGAQFPYVLANVDRPGGASLLPPYVILKRDFIDDAGRSHSVRIGVLGLVTPQIMMWDKAHLEGKVTASDIVERARLYAPRIRAEGADIVVALAHTGFGSDPAQPMDENAALALTELTGIDAVISGHAHRVFPDPAYATLPGADLVQGTLHAHPAVMPGFYGSHLGVMDLELVQAGGAWRIAVAKAEARPISRRANGKIVPTVESDPELAAIVAADHQRTLAYVRQPIGRTTRPINSFFALIEPDPCVAIVSVIQRQAVEAALKAGPYAGLPILSAASPFRAGGAPGAGYYTDIPIGELAIKNVGDLYIYSNTLAAVRVTGAELREWLEKSAVFYRRIDPAAAEPQMLFGNAPAYVCDMISGVTYEIDLTQPPRYERFGHVVASGARRIRNLAYQGKPVADDAVFVVATNDHRANGGDNFPGLDGRNVILASPDILQNIIADYIRAVREITPRSDANWRFAPIATPVDVRFQSSPKAKTYLPDHGRVSWIGPGDNGFDLYRLDLS